MDAEVFDRIAKLAQVAALPKVVPLPDRFEAVLVAKPDGAVEQLDYPSIAVRPAFGDVESFAAYVRLGTVGIDGLSVFVDGGKAILCGNGEAEPVLATLAIPFTDRFARAVQPLSTAMSVSEARRFLRLDLWGPESEKVYAALGKVDFSRTNAGTAERSHGRESLGRSVEAKVQARDEIPESFTVDLVAYAVAGLEEIKASVEVCVLLDPQNERIEFRVRTDAAQAAITAARRGAVRALRTALPDDVAIYHGRPR